MTPEASTARCAARTARRDPLVHARRTSHGHGMHRSLVTIVTVVAGIACGGAPRTVSRFDDDYEAARQQAVRSKLPLVVEVWAPW